MLLEHGHQVRCYTRSSVELEAMRFGKARAFFSGFHNPASVREVKKVVEEFMPDVVHVHNLYPLISPAILPHIRKFGVPVVMTVHNYRLLCPNGLFYNRTGICEECAGGKEWNCVRFNCEESLPKSIGYAFRNAWARVARYYLDNVDAFLCLTEFQKQKLIDNGFARDRCFVLPNFFDGKLNTTAVGGGKNTGTYVAFAGRISKEKGINLLYSAARLLPDISFRIAGKVADPVFFDKKPDNVELTGLLSEEELQDFYANATLFILSSVCYEGFPMVILEAMNFGLPVIVPRLGGMPEIVRDGVTGRTYEPGSCEDLAKAIKELWHDKKAAFSMSRSSHEELIRNYLPEVYYKGLVGIYGKLKRGPV